MNHFLDTLAFFFFFMLGVVLVLWAKISDINDMKEELTIRTSLNLFMKKEWKSYGFSITFALFYAGAHDEWIKMIVTNKWTPDFFIDNIGAAPMIFSAIFGAFVQWTGYRFWLGKLDKIFRRQQQMEQSQLKAENQELKNQLKQSDN